MRLVIKMTVICSIALSFFACNEDKIDYNDNSISLIVKANNPYNAITTVQTLSNQKVYVKEKGSDFYLFEATSDDDGSIDFSLLEKEKEYVAYSSISIDSIPFYGEVEFVLGAEGIELVLSPATNEFNGFRIKCIDGQGAAIPSVDICLFESQTVAMTADCSVSTLSGSSSVYGVYMETRIAARNYYISIVDTVGGIPIGYQDSILVNETGVTEKEIVVIP